MVVVRVVADVAGDVGLLEPADPVLEPGRPGTAHGRARVTGSRAYGWKPARSVRFGTEMSGRSSTLGMGHGSEPVARKASDR